MKKDNIIDELRWRGLVDSHSNDIETFLDNKVTAYIGFDPTSDSLHIGSLVPIILLKHLENYGHNPIVLIGGSTGMIGDPSGKSSERNLLDNETLVKNSESITSIISKFLNPQTTTFVNNYDWMKDISFIDFVRDVGKKIPVNYMLSKESVKRRIETDGEGMSFTEFTYQLFQAYDFLHLNEKFGCTLQMGGSDQWGNMTTGLELIRKTNGNECKILTTPLVKKSDGTKFGKTENGNIWLTEEKTSVYDFYQFWLNTSDEDAEKYIKIFTFLDESEVNDIINEHNIDRSRKHLQRMLADNITTFVHGDELLSDIKDVSELLFGKNNTIETLKIVNVSVLSDVLKNNSFDLVLEDEVSIVDLLVNSKFIESKTSARRFLKENAISLNMKKIKEDYLVTKKDVINGIILLQRGKKTFKLIKTS